MAMSNDGTLPLEILTDVLSRLPIKSLCRLKCVSLSWKTLISSPHFAQTHLNRTNTQNPNLNLKIILVSTSQALYSVDFTEANPTAKKLDFPSAEQHSDEWVQVFSSSNGLLLVSDENYSNLFLLNPSTRECKKLPPLPIVLNKVNRRFHLFLYGVGYDSSRNDYKVVMLCRDITVSEFGLIGTKSPTGSDTRVVIVYSLKTDAWRRIQDTHCNPREGHPQVSVNGCLHCVCWNRNESYVIAAFDLSDETQREVPLPASFHGYHFMFYKLALIGGCLCLVCSMSRMTSKIDVWMMKEYGVRDSWTNFTIGPGMSLGFLCCVFSENNFLLKTYEQTLHELVVFNSEKEILRDMVVCGIPPEFKFGGTYIESFVSLNHGGGKGLRGNE